jgi:hypothetical protein
VKAARLLTLHRVGAPLTQEQKGALRDAAEIAAAEEWDDTWHIASVRDCGGDSPAELAAWARHEHAKQVLTKAITALRATTPTEPTP